MLSSESNGISSYFLESTHVIPKFHTYYCCGDKLEAIEDDNPLIFLSDKPSVKSRFLYKAHNRKDLYCVDWSSDHFKSINCDDEHGNRAHLLLDRYPQRQHSFVGLVQRDKLYDVNKGRDKIVNFATKGYTLHSTKSRSDVYRPNGG